MPDGAFKRLRMQVTITLTVVPLAPLGISRVSDLKSLFPNSNGTLAEQFAPFHSLTTLQRQRFSIAE